MQLSEMNSGYYINISRWIRFCIIGSEWYYYGNTFASGKRLLNIR